jgi:hypothetical protein
VIRRRVRWALRLGLVFVLALSLSVVGAIRTNQQAQAFAPMLAPAAPVLVASGPAGWAVLGGAGVLLGGVYLADKYRQGDSGLPDQTPLDWLNDMLKPDAVGQGLKDWFTNKDQDKEPETKDESPPDPSTVVKNPRDWVLSNFREIEASGGSKQLSVDVDYDDPLPWGGNEAMFSTHELQCRKADGSIYPQSGRGLRVLDYIGRIGDGSTGLFDMQTFGIRCADSTHATVSVSLNPMSQEQWNLVDATKTYPRNGRDTTIDEGVFWIFKDAYKGTDGNKITVRCKAPDGTTTAVVTTSKDGQQQALESCPSGAVPESIKAERTLPGGGVHPTPVAEATVTGERPVSVAVDGQACTMGRADCVNWSQINATQPERVQCSTNGQVIPTAHCNTVERFYENGGTVVHPYNIDGKPGTRYDPRQDADWTPLYPVQDGGGVLAPTRPGTPYPSPTSPDELPWDPDEVPAEPLDPYEDPNSPLYDPTLDPFSPDYDPMKDPDSPDYYPKRDPRNPDYDPARDPAHPSYDPALDPFSPDYDPYADPDSPLYDPEPEPEPEPSQPPEPEPSPTAPAEPEPSPTGDPQPEPTSDPEPSQEPTEDPGEGEEPEPDPEPSAEPTAEPTMEPQPEEAEPPLPPRPQSVDVDEDGHLIPLSAAVATTTMVGPGGSMIYADPTTGLQTVRAPDGTKTTTIYHTPVGTDTPQKIETVQAPDGTKTTTQPGYPLIVTPGNMAQAPSTGTIPIAPPGTNPDPPGTGTPGAGDPTPPLSEPPGSPQQNCMAGAYSWNPIHWVYVPVKCALTWAFKPDPVRFQANVDGTLQVYTNKGIGPMIENYDRVIASIPLGGEGCMGPPMTVPALGGMTPEATYYLFNACDDMAPMAAKTNLFAAFVISVMGGLSVIRALASGFGFSFKPAPESDWYAASK